MIERTFVGSWYRTPEVEALLRESPTGEIANHEKEVERAERTAIREQLHPLGGNSKGLTWVSNGEQRKSGYTTYLPNRFHGFSSTEKVPPPGLSGLVEELKEANPALLAALSSQSVIASLPKVEDRLAYVGAALARDEAQQAVRLAREEGAPKVFVTAPSPGVITVFFPPGRAYRDHLEYLGALSAEIRKEYEAILSVDGAYLQIDAPDLAMAKQLSPDWGIDFYEALPYHVDAINEAVKGLPKERIRVHYCYGNYLSSHVSDADFRRVLPEIARLNVSAIVGETANPRHEGDVLIYEDYVREHGWPKGLKLAVSVVDVKTPFVESAETVAVRLDRYAAFLGAENIMASTDCGFQTFLGLDNVPKAIALKKLAAIAEGTE
ncbi:MAG: hypothetical protein ACP5LS_05790, partial [Thermoprotei archaeon]